MKVNYYIRCIEEFWPGQGEEIRTARIEVVDPNKHFPTEVGRITCADPYFSWLYDKIENIREEKKEDKKEDFLSQIPKPNRERIRDVLIDVLADGHVPESDFLIRPFERGVDALVLEFRKLEGKGHLDDDLTSKIIAAIRAAYEDEENWQFSRADTPTTPVIACIVAGGRRGPKRAAARAEWQEASQRTQEALRERKQAVREQGDDPLWEQVLLELSLQMAQGMFDTYLKNTKLLAPPDCGTIRVGVQSQLALEWIENRLRPIIERALAGFGIERVEFEVLGISGSDVRPLMRGEEDASN